MSLALTDLDCNDRASLMLLDRLDPAELRYAPSVLRSLGEPYFAHVVHARRRHREHASRCTKYFHQAV